MADDVRQVSLYSDIAMEHLELADWGNAERLSCACLTRYKSLEEKGGFLLPTQTIQKKYCSGRALLEQGKFDEAEPMLLASLLSDKQRSDGWDTTAHQAAVAALERLYLATDRPELARQWREKP